MQCQYALLLYVLDWHKAHIGSSYRLTDRLVISGIIFVGLNLRLDELGCRLKWGRSSHCCGAASATYEIAMDEGQATPQEVPPSDSSRPIQHWAEQPYGYERYRTERIEINAILNHGDINDGHQAICGRNS